MNFDDFKNINAYDETSNNQSFIQRDLNNKNNNKRQGIILKIISIIAFVFFCLNIFLTGLLYYNVKNNLNKKLNINYYNVSVDGEQISTYAVQNAKKSSVCIASGGYATDETSFFNNTSSRGSGVILKFDYDKNVVYILTCYHVVMENINKIYILFSSSLKPIEASLVGYTSTYDLAVLKSNIPSNVENCIEISVRNNQLLSVGENVFAIGNSLSGGLSVTSGVISMLNKEVVIGEDVFREIQTDASINPGNSGGGLFDSTGRFIGLVNAKLSKVTSSNVTMSVEGMSFAIPSIFAVSIANSIILNSGFPTYVDFGLVFENSEDYVSSINLDDNIIDDYEVKVKSISSNSILNGVLKVNDVVISFRYYDLFGNINEVQMTNKYCLDDIMFNIMDNSVIEFDIIRPLLGDEKTINVTLNIKFVQK